MSPGSLFDFIILLSFSVAIINSDPTPHCDDTLFTIVVGDTLINCVCNSCIDILAWAVTPYLTTFAILTLMYYRGRCPLTNYDYNFALMYYRGRCPLTNCHYNFALMYYRVRCLLTNCHYNFALIYYRVR